MRDSSGSDDDGPKICGVIIDLDDPDLDMVAIKVAARHSELLGLELGARVWQVICHLNRVTDKARILKRPTSVLHFLQKTWRNFLGAVSSSANELRSNPASTVEEEYWRA